MRFSIHTGDLVVAKSYVAPLSDTGSTTARSVDEVALIRDTISYALVLPHLCQSQSRRTGAAVAVNKRT
jgi:hypothetical protein